MIAGGLPEGFRAALDRACRGATNPPQLVDTASASQLLEEISTVGTAERTLVMLSGGWLRDEGFTLLVEIQRLQPNVAVLLVGANIEALALGHALRLGLRGLADPDMDTAQIERALHVICSGELWISRRQLLEVLQVLGPADGDPLPGVWLKLPSLTLREHAVLRRLLEGKANKSIARELEISDKTVKIHLQSVYRKLGVHRRVDLLKALNL